MESKSKCSVLFLTLLDVIVCMRNGTQLGVSTGVVFEPARGSMSLDGFASAVGVAQLLTLSQTCSHMADISTVAILTGTVTVDCKIVN